MLRARTEVYGVFAIEPFSEEDLMRSDAIGMT
jgi:hypothetical protein